MIRVKICGITNLEDALAAADAGCDALGFVFYRKSPRYIRPEDALKIIKQLPVRIIKIGVFVNGQEKAIKKIAQMCHLDMIQFHGGESPQFCSRFKGYKIIKAFRIKDRIDLRNVYSYKTFAYLFDTFVKARFGGTGRNFNWKLLQDIDNIKRPVFLSGGLNEKNVKEALKLTQPDWIDVSSSLETSPGKKDPLKIKRFIQALKPYPTS